MSAFWGVLTKRFFNSDKTITLKNALFNMEFDFISAEGHSWSSDITLNPVETGSTVTDHIQKNPDQLSLSGVISNSPIGLWRGSIKESIDAFFDNESPTQKAFDKLYQLMETREPVTIYTKYRHYPNMVLTSLSIPRKAADGNSIEFSAQFKQIRMVSTLLVESKEAGIYPENSDSKETKQKTEDKKNKGLIHATHYSIK